PGLIAAAGENADTLAGDRVARHLRKLAFLARVKTSDGAIDRPGRLVFRQRRAVDPETRHDAVRHFARERLPRHQHHLASDVQFLAGGLRRLDRDALRLAARTGIAEGREVVIGQNCNLWAREGLRLAAGVALAEARQGRRLLLLGCNDGALVLCGEPRETVRARGDEGCESQNLEGTADHGTGLIRECCCVVAKTYNLDAANESLAS